MLYQEIFDRELATANQVDRLYTDSKAVISALKDTLNVNQLAQMLLNVQYLEADLSSSIHECMEALSNITSQTSFAVTENK